MAPVASWMWQSMLLGLRIPCGRITVPCTGTTWPIWSGMPLEKLQCRSPNAVHFEVLGADAEPIEVQPGPSHRALFVATVPGACVGALGERAVGDRRDTATEHVEHRQVDLITTRQHEPHLCGPSRVRIDRE